jgi:maleate cis-trans isomerase
VNPSELVPLLVSRMNLKSEFDQVLNAMKKFPKAAPELLNDASLAVMMASERQDVLEKIKEYRTHY